MAVVLLGPNGKEVKVSNEGELFTHSRTIETMGFINQHEGHVWTLPFDAFDPDATDKKWLYIKNESEVVDIHMRHFILRSTVAGTMEVLRVTGTAAAGSGVTLVNHNDNFPTRVPKGIFETGADITGLTDGGKYRTIYLVADVERIINVQHDIILGPGSAMALNWPEATGVFTGGIEFFTHSPLEE